MHTRIDLAPSSVCLGIVSCRDFLLPCFNIVPHLFVRGRVNFLAESCAVRIACCEECIVGRDFTHGFSHQTVLHVRHISPKGFVTAEVRIYSQER